jgi:hypothetical protein
MTPRPIPESGAKRSALKWRWKREQGRGTGNSGYHRDDDFTLVYALRCNRRRRNVQNA